MKAINACEFTSNNNDPELNLNMCHPISFVVAMKAINVSSPAIIMILNLINLNMCHPISFVS